MSSYQQLNRSQIADSHGVATTDHTVKRSNSGKSRVTSGLRLRRCSCTGFLLLASFLLVFWSGLIHAGAEQLVAGVRPAVEQPELDDMRYMVVMDSGNGGTPSHPAGRMHVMRDASGREYECVLPPLPPPPTGDGGPQETPIPRTSDAKELQQQALEHLTPKELLSALDAVCFYRAEEWWTYEVCHGKGVRQFHKDAATERLANEYKLGTYNEGESDPDTVHVDPSSEGDAAKYVRELYTDGELCDITQRPRSTEVRYTCVPDVKDGILSIREASTCEYVVYIAIQNLCSHPGFKAKEPPLSLITCRRLGAEDDDEDEYGDDVDGEDGGARLRERRNAGKGVGEVGDDDDEDEYEDDDEEEEAARQDAAKTKTKPAAKAAGGSSRGSKEGGQAKAAGKDGTSSSSSKGRGGNDAHDDDDDEYLDEYDDEFEHDEL